MKFHGTMTRHEKVNKCTQGQDEENEKKATVDKILGPESATFLHRQCLLSGAPQPAQQPLTPRLRTDTSTITLRVGAQPASGGVILWCCVRNRYLVSYRGSAEIYGAGDIKYGFTFDRKVDKSDITKTHRCLSLIHI